MKNILYVGLDDSNHAGTSKGELIVAIFSRRPKDGQEREFKNRRFRCGTESWLDENNRDYRVTLLADPKFRSYQFNLFLAAPYLVQSYLDQNKAAPLEGMSVFIDGRGLPRWEQVLREDFRGIPNTDIRTYVKKRQGRQVCPPVVKHADTWANTLFREKSVEEILTSPKFVPLDSEEILERAKERFAR